MNALLAPFSLAFLVELDGFWCALLLSHLPSTFLLVDLYMRIRRFRTPATDKFISKKRRKPPANKEWKCRRQVTRPLHVCAFTYACLVGRWVSVVLFFAYLQVLTMAGESGRSYGICMFNPGTLSASVYPKTRTFTRVFQIACVCLPRRVGRA